jgi:hypothetical protein
MLQINARANLGRDCTGIEAIVRALTVFELSASVREAGWHALGNLAFQHVSIAERLASEGAPTYRAYDITFTFDGKSSKPCNWVRESHAGVLDAIRYSVCQVV